MKQQVKSCWLQLQTRSAYVLKT